MNRPFVASLALLLVTGLATGACGSPAPKEADDRLPDVTLAGFDGAEDVDLGDLTGPAIVSVWASWCSPCRNEMPVLEEFHAAYGDEVDLLGIDYQDAQVDDARALVERTGVTYSLVRDPDGDINAQGAFPSLRGLPFLAFVDEEGTVTHVEAVVIESVPELVAMVDDHLGVVL